MRQQNSFCEAFVWTETLPDGISLHIAEDEEGNSTVHYKLMELDSSVFSVHVDLRSKDPNLLSSPRGVKSSHGQ